MFKFIKSFFKNRRVSNFIAGIGSICEIFPPPMEKRHGYSCPSDQTVAEALRKDWENVGEDLEKAMGTMGKQIEQEENKRVMQELLKASKNVKQKFNGLKQHPYNGPAVEWDSDESKRYPTNNKKPDYKC